MARFIILVTVLAALLLVANASNSKREQESCKQQLRSVNLKKCENYLKEKLEEEEEQEDRVLSFRGIHSLRRSSESEQLEKCCEELNELDSSKCQCRALQKIYERQSEKLQNSSDEQDLEDELKKLPKLCRLGHLRGCDLSSED